MALDKATIITALSELSAEDRSAISDAIRHLDVVSVTEAIAPQPLIRVAIGFNPYNQRRYSRPWIARVTSWPVGSKPSIEWGSYLGDDNGGEVEIQARPGDIVRYGQKDGRGNNGRSKWAIVLADGSVEAHTESECRKAYVGK